MWCNTYLNFRVGDCETVVGMPGGIDRPMTEVRNTWLILNALPSDEMLLHTKHFPTFAGLSLGPASDEHNEEEVPGRLKEQTPNST
jgi:hypothetical protein